MGIGLGLAVLAAGCLAWLVRRTFGAESSEVATAMRVAEKCAVAELVPNTLVRIHGVAREVDGTVTGPVSGRTCVYWALRVQELQRNGNSNDVWQSVFGDSDHAVFAVDDGTGKAYVDPLGAEVVLHFDKSSSHVPAKYTAQLTPGRSYRCQEAVICDGGRIALAGSAAEVAATPPADADAYRSPPANVWRFASNDVFKLAITDARRFR
jgi:hypothetical protein